MQGLFFVLVKIKFLDDIGDHVAFVFNLVKSIVLLSCSQTPIRVCSAYLKALPYYYSFYYFDKLTVPPRSGNIEKSYFILISCISTHSSLSTGESKANFCVTFSSLSLSALKSRC